MGQGDSAKPAVPIVRCCLNNPRGIAIMIWNECFEKHGMIHAYFKVIFQNIPEGDSPTVHDQPSLFSLFILKARCGLLRTGPWV